MHDQFSTNHPTNHFSVFFTESLRLLGCCVSLSLFLCVYL